MKNFLGMFLFVAMSFFLMACDGKDGGNGPMGPSGVEELSQVACPPDKVVATDLDDRGHPILLCLTPDQFNVLEAEKAAEAAEAEADEADEVDEADEADEADEVDANEE